MVVHRRAGAALFNAGRYADARAVWRRGQLDRGDDLCAGLADMAMEFESAETGSNREPPTITVAGEAIDVAHLDAGALATAAAILVERAGGDPAPLREAAVAAREESGERYRGLLVDVLGGGTDGAVASERLSALIDRRQTRTHAVAGLFDPEETGADGGSEEG